MKLVSVYERRDRADLLWALLMERDATPGINISHEKMPTFQEHVAFVESKPYYAWYFIVDQWPVGSIYLSKQTEIGVFVFKAHWNNGYGKEAIKALMEKHGPMRYLANINPHNKRSAKLFKGLGFNLIQYTYERVSGNLIQNTYECVSGS